MSNCAALYAFVTLLRVSGRLCTAKARANVRLVLLSCYVWVLRSIGPCENCVRIGTSITCVRHFKASVLSLRVLSVWQVYSRGVYGSIAQASPARTRTSSSTIADYGAFTPPAGTPKATAAIAAGAAAEGLEEEEEDLESPFG